MFDLFAEIALLPTGWADNVRIKVGTGGDIEAVKPGADAKGAERIRSIVLPGMPNLHSHAFQRAIAGLGERAGPGEDSFWVWRDVMYRFVERITPEDLYSIAAQLYAEMLKVGYTAVGEFHYVHADADGKVYADPAEMSERIFEAAGLTGIGLTHLPVLYASSGFGGEPPTQGQRRFVTGVDGFLSLVQELDGRHSGDPQVRIGIAPHSLRAVPPDALATCLDGLDAIDDTAPIHIHVAEQVREIEDCLAWSGARPVEWLLANAPVSERWCLVHATHMNDDEAKAFVRSGAVAGLCPTTEANLGDGLFPLAPYLASGGRFGIGSDSHVSVNVIEELRWLEYGQRLNHRRRNVAALGAGASTGAELFKGAIEGGSQALARPIGGIAEGRRADLVVLDRDHPALAEHTGDTLLDAYVFATNTNPVRDVMVGGKWVVRDGHHAEEESIFRDFRRTMARILETEP